MQKILKNPLIEKNPIDKLSGNNIALPLSGLTSLYRKYYFSDFKLDELIFCVTDKCQFRCKTCFYADTMDASDMKAVKGLSIAEIKKISNSIGNINKLLITGGEPFLRDDLAEISETFTYRIESDIFIFPQMLFKQIKIINRQKIF